MRTEDKVMNKGKLPAKQEKLKSLPCPSPQSSLFNSRGSSLNTQLPCLVSNSPAPNPDQSTNSPSISSKHNSKCMTPNPQSIKESATRCSQHSSECVTRFPQHIDESGVHFPQHLFIDASTELLRQRKNVRFQAPGRSMHPAIKEGETITVAPIAPFDIKRGDILLYIVGRKVIAHRVVRIKRKKGDSMIQSSTLNPQHLFILRGDASATCDFPVEAQQVLGKVVSVEKGGRSIDLYSRKARMLRIARACTSRLKKLILHILKANKGVGLTFGSFQ